MALKKTPFVNCVLDHKKIELSLMQLISPTSVTLRKSWVFTRNGNITRAPRGRGQKNQGGEGVD